MNSTVRFSIDSSGDDFCLTLVYPKDVDGSGDKISILAPVGSALLGLSTGDEIEWPRPGGGMIKVRIVEIVYQPEREGNSTLEPWSRADKPKKATAHALLRCHGFTARYIS